MVNAKADKIEERYIKSQLAKEILHYTQEQYWYSTIVPYTFNVFCKITNLLISLNLFFKLTKFNYFLI